MQILQSHLIQSTSVAVTLASIKVFLFLKRIIRVWNRPVLYGYYTGIIRVCIYKCIRKYLYVHIYRYKNFLPPQVSFSFHQILQASPTFHQNISTSSISMAGHDWPRETPHPLHFANNPLSFIFLRDVWGTHGMIL